MLQSDWLRFSLFTPWYAVCGMSSQTVCSEKMTLNEKHEPALLSIFEQPGELFCIEDSSLSISIGASLNSIIH